MKKHLVYLALFAVLCSCKKDQSEPATLTNVARFGFTKGFVHSTSYGDALYLTTAGITMVKDTTGIVSFYKPTGNGNYLTVLLYPGATNSIMLDGGTYHSTEQWQPGFQSIAVHTGFNGASSTDVEEYQNGTVKVEHFGTNDYKITFDATGYNDEKLTGAYTGVIEILL